MKLKRTADAVLFCSMSVHDYNPIIKPVKNGPLFLLK